METRLNTNQGYLKNLLKQIDDYTGDFEYTHIPEEGRRSFLTVLLVWLGFNINISEIASGVLVYANLGVGKGILAVAIGCLMLGIVGSLVSIPCQKLGITYGLLTQYVWGEKGSVYASVMIALGEALWISFLTSMTGTLFNVMFGWPLMLSTIISGILFMTTALIGFKALAFLSYAAVFSIFFGLLSSSILTINPYLDQIKTYVPADPKSLWWGVSMVYGTWAVGITHTGDITRFCRKPAHVWITTILVFICSEVFLMTTGGLIALGTGEVELIAAFKSAGFVVAGTIIIFLATWTTADNCLYSSALPLSSAAQALGHPIDKWKIAVVLGVIFNVIIAALGLYRFYENFLEILVIFWVGFAGVTIADYWLVHKGKGKYNLTIDKVRKETEQINWRAFIAYALACLTAYYVEFLPHPEFPLILNSSAFDALIVGALSYWLLSLNRKDLNLNGGNRI